MSVDISDLPSWVIVLLIGIGIFGAISMGFLDPAYRFGESSFSMASLGRLLIIGGVLLGAFYFSKDISNKM